MMQEIAFLNEDITRIDEISFVPWERLRDKTLLLTGATGLVGSGIVRLLNYVNNRDNLNVRLLALVRSAEKAQTMFSDIFSSDMFVPLIGSVENLPQLDEKVDYIIHGANQTASRKFIDHPVETIDTTVFGTKSLLDLAKENDVLGFVYLSSMEVYGFPEKGHKVSEIEVGSFDPANLRNSYPIGKIVGEAMCAAYASEYGLPAMSVRLTQTVAPFVSDSDKRIWSYFGECVREKKNIVLKTTGETERSYLHVIDAATAIFTVLLNGIPGQAYNVSDEATYCSIVKMAQKVAQIGGIEVEFDIQNTTVNGYPETLYINLNTDKLEGLGWYPVVEVLRKLM